MEQKIIDETHLLQFSNFELLTTGLRRIFNLSRRRSKRRNRNDTANEIEPWRKRRSDSRLITAFRSSRRCVRVLIFHCSQKGRRIEQRKRRVQWEWLADIIWVKKEKKKRKGKSKLTLPFPPAFLSLHLLLLNPSLLETPRVSARYGQHVARCFPTARKRLCKFCED